MTQSEKLRLIVSLSVPSILAQISATVMFFIDYAMVGHLGEKATAAVGLVESSTWLMGGLASAVSMGFSVQVAHFIGANDFEAARRVLRQSLVCCFVWSFMLSLFCVAIHRHLPFWLGGTADIAGDASLYFLIVGLCGMLFQMEGLAGSMLKCSGNMRIPSALNILMCVLDVAFNYFFIYVMNLGVPGAALGTGLAVFVTALLMLYFLLFRSSMLRLKGHPGSFRPQADTVRTAFKIGAPMGLQHLLMGSAQVVSTIIVAPLGTVAIAANSMAITVESLCYMPGYGIAEAATTLVGQGIGAGQRLLTRSFARMSVALGMLVMTAMGVLMYVFAPELMSLLSPVDAIVAEGAQALRIEAFAEPFFAAAIVCNGIFIGAGDTLIPAVMSLASMWCVRLTLAATLASRLGLRGVWTAMAIELTFRGSIFLARLFRGNWASQLSRKAAAVVVACLLSSLLPLSAQDFGTQDFGEASWIGAITRSDSHLPEGRTFSGTTLKDSAVKAAWAQADPLSRQSIWLRKHIDVAKGVVSAKAYVCGLGFYELYIDGSKTDDNVMAPSWSDFDKTLYYNVIDVTSLICKKGRHELRVLLGNGFFNEQGGRYHKMKISFGPPTLLLRLTVTYADGSQGDIVSDDTWQWAASPITFNSIYGGEDYDARLEGSAEWHGAVVQESPRGMLRRQSACPVKVMERYGVARRLSRFEPATAGQAASEVFDMGQNLSGFPEILVRGRRGQQVKLTPGETLTADGHVDQRQTGRPHYYVYTLGSDGLEAWHPHFSYYGFRYIEVEGAVLEGDANPDGLPVLSSLTSCFIHNSAPKTGSFECSNQIFNGAYRIIDRAVRSNWQAVWTDCPHREKLGWLEQDWLNAEGLVSSYDCKAMMAQTMQNIADAQHPDGAIPTTAPQYTVFPGETWGKPFNESPEWAGTFVYLPKLFIDYYGDDSLLKAYYPSIVSYVDYLHSLSADGLIDQGLGDWYDYRDGEKAGFAKNTSVAYVSSAHYYQWTRLASLFADRLGHGHDAVRLAARSDSIRRAINSRFLHDHLYDTGSQCAQAIALDMGLAHDADRDSVMARLVSDIHAHGDRLTTGDVGNRYLFNVLAYSDRREHHELLYRMLNHYGTPGYGYQLLQGMTTLSEQWNPKFGSSMNHFMMAHVANLLIPRFLGLKLNGPADRVDIQPMPVGDLTWCKGAIGCPRGTATCHWRRTGGRFVIDVSLPAGQQGLLTMPYSGTQHLLSGGNAHFEESEK